VNIDRATIHRVLIIKLRAVGDVLLSTIVLGNIRAAFPAARIDFLTEPPSREIIHGNPGIDDALIFDRRTMSGWDLIRLVRKNAYDLVIDLFGNPRSAIVTRCSGARVRVGYDFRWRKHAYTVVVPPRGGMVHNTQFNLDALEAIGVAIQDRNLYFPTSPEDDAYVERFLRGAGVEGRLLVAINTGGGWYTKRWGLDRYALLGDALVERHNAAVVLPWGPGQLSDVESVKARMRHPAIIPPATTLRQLGALLKRCAMVVSNDSGPMHIAAAVGTPVVGVYGPTNPILQGPYGDRHVIVRKEGLPCLGCNRTKCPIGHPCMLELTVETVLDGVELLLRKNSIQ